MRPGVGLKARERKQFFFGKKNQKTFIHLLRTLPGWGKALLAYRLTPGLAGIFFVFSISTLAAGAAIGAGVPDRNTS